MESLSDLIPEAAALMGMTPDELGDRLVPFLRKWPENHLFALMELQECVAGDRPNSFSRENYPAYTRAGIRIALAEAWASLERRGIIVPDTEGMGGVKLSREAKEVTFSTSGRDYVMGMGTPAQQQLAKTFFDPFFNWDDDEKLREWLRHQDADELERFLDSFSFQNNKDRQTLGRQELRNLRSRQSLDASRSITPQVVPAVPTTYLLKGWLHVTLQQDAWNAFDRGEYEPAIMSAMKAVEVRVRTSAGFTNADHGKDMIARAFNPRSGPLRDEAAEPAERDALLALMTGAYGLYRNKFAHRHVGLSDPAEAAEIIMLASHLLRIVDTRSPAVAQPE